MKKNMIFFLGLLVLTVGLFAQTEADFNLGLTQDGKGVVITGYTGTAVAVKIPATIQGMPVREIGEYAFRGKRNITSVVIPEGVTVIRDDAFADSHKLVQVALPSTLRIIEFGAFNSDTNLKSIVIPEGVTEIGGSAFLWCSSLASVTLPQSLVTLGSRAFEGTAITSITLPPKLTVIKSGTFLNCAKLTSVVISEGVTEIESESGLRTFGSCTALTSVTFPSTIKKIGGYAFENCSSLITITIPDTVETIEMGERAFDGCGKLNLATQARLRKITETTAERAQKQREAEQAQKQREAEERRAQENRAWEEREAQEKREQDERLAQAQREREIWNGLGMRLDILYQLPRTRKFNKDQFAEFMSICEGYVKLGKNIFSDNVIDLLIGERLDNNQKEQFYANFR